MNHIGRNFVYTPSNTDQKYRLPSKSDAGKILIPKKLLVTPWYTTLYMRGNKQDNEANIIDGDVVIGELIKANMLLLPFAIDPHGRWGPNLQHFLSLLDKALDYNFPQHQPNA